MLFCIKVKPMHKEAESFPPMILLLLYPYYIRICSEPTSKMLRISSPTILVKERNDVKSVA